MTSFHSLVSPGRVTTWKRSTRYDDAGPASSGERHSRMGPGIRPHAHMSVVFTPSGPGKARMEPAAEPVNLNDRMPSACHTLFVVPVP